MRRTVASTSDTLRAYWMISGRTSPLVRLTATPRWRVSTRNPPTRARARQEDAEVLGVLGLAQDGPSRSGRSGSMALLDAA